jgi:hypothetical protein
MRLGRHPRTEFLGHLGGLSFIKTPMPSSSEFSHLIDHPIRDRLVGGREILPEWVN